MFTPQPRLIVDIVLFIPPLKRSCNALALSWHTFS